MHKKILVLNGPNLNLLGEREPAIYGSTTLESIEKSCRKLADTMGIDLDFCQSNHEGELVDLIQAARLDTDAIIFNPAGYSFHSVPILDALRIYPGIIIETHLSNIHARDAQHRSSILSAVSTGVVCGLGAYGYIAALQAAVYQLGLNSELAFGL